MQSKAGHRRSRATAACLPCRKGRTRCLTDKGSNKCTNCTQNGNECVFDSRDGRKERALAKSETEALSRRVLQLEELLRQQSDAQTPLSTPLTQLQSACQPSATSQMHNGKSEAQLGQMPPPSDVPRDSPASAKLSNRSDAEDQISVVRNLVPSPIRFDMSSGRVRYFGPTTNMNVLTTSSQSEALERRETHWPICMVVKDMAMETHDYLMELYWTCHNAVLHLVHYDAFYHDMERGGTQFYSVFLHLAILATGFKYADKTRKDIQRLSTAGNSESTLHEKARAFAKLEQDGPGGIPSIQAFGLLADIEFNIGRDDSGWLFAGMSLRLVFDVGLHVDPSPLRLTERETQIRHMVLWASLVRDMQWSLYLGRPTTLKLDDIAPACLSRDFTKLILSRSTPREKQFTTRIFEALLRLMGLISPICDRRMIAKPPRTTEAYFKMASLDEELNGWLSDLPAELKWPPQNKEMPGSYYLLYSQYHAALILLHRPFVQYELAEPTPETAAGDSNTARFTNLSRTICADSAGRIVEIFEQYRANLDLTRVYGTALAHAGSAATALMGEAILQTEKRHLGTVIAQLTSLKQTISEIAVTYPPGHFMASIVDGYISSISPQGGDEHPPQQDTAMDQETTGNVTSMPPPPPNTATTMLRNGGQNGAEPLRGRDPMQNPYSFTPTEAASHSIQGLPFLPSSFLEGLSTQDMLISEQIGYSDYGYSWEANPDSV